MTPKSHDEYTSQMGRSGKATARHIPSAWSKVKSMDIAMTAIFTSGDIFHPSS